MIIDELNKKISDIENLANDKTGSLESKVNDLTDGILMVADAVDIIPEMVDEKITAITKEFSAIKDTVSKVKAQKGDKGDRGEPGIDGVGIKGDKGEDGSPDTGEQIVEKLNSLEGVLDTKVLKDFEMPDVKDLERQINTIGNQTLRLLSRPATQSTSSSFTGVVTDSTLTGVGTEDSPLSVVATSASDVAVTVRAATTAALAGSPIYNNGTAGVGATLTRGTNGVLPNQDGRTLQVADRLLVKNQSSTLQNGVYEVTSLGSVSTPWELTRTTDADSTSELDELVVTVSEGSTLRGTVWGQQTNNPVVGTDAITFATVVSTAVTQATSGTQAIGQIPYWTSTTRQISKGDAGFTRNPITKDTIIGRSFINGSDTDPTDVSIFNISDIGNGSYGVGITADNATISGGFGFLDASTSGSDKIIYFQNIEDVDGNSLNISGTRLSYAVILSDENGNNSVMSNIAGRFETSVTPNGYAKRGFKVAGIGDNIRPSWVYGNTDYYFPRTTPNIGDIITVASQDGDDFILDFSSKKHIDGVPQYADDATAIADGLVTGDLYSTTVAGSTFLKIVP